MTTPANTAPEAYQAADLDSIFDSQGGGSGAPSFAWPSELGAGNKVLPVIGGAIQGEVTDIFVTVVKDAQTREPKVNKRGAQMPQVNLTLQTALRNWEGAKSVPVDEETGQPKPASEDTGERRIYVKFKMLDALAAAIKESTQKSGGPRKGAKVAVRVTKLVDVGQMNPLTEYEAKYVPPVDDPSADIFNTQQQAQAPAATPAAPASAPAADPWAQAAPASSGWGTDEPPF